MATLETRTGEIEISETEVRENPTSETNPQGKSLNIYQKIAYSTIIAGFTVLGACLGADLHTKDYLPFIRQRESLQEQIQLADSATKENLKIQLKNLKPKEIPVDNQGYLGFCGYTSIWAVGGLAAGLTVASTLFPKSD